MVCNISGCCPFAVFKVFGAVPIHIGLVIDAVHLKVHARDTARAVRQSCGIHLNVPPDAGDVYRLVAAEEAAEDTEDPEDEVDRLSVLHKWSFRPDSPHAESVDPVCINVVCAFEAVKLRDIKQRLQSEPLCVPLKTLTALLDVVHTSNCTLLMVLPVPHARCISQEPALTCLRSIVSGGRKYAVGIHLRPVVAACATVTVEKTSARHNPNTRMNLNADFFIFFTSFPI